MKLSDTQRRVLRVLGKPGAYLSVGVFVVLYPGIITVRYGTWHRLVQRGYVQESGISPSGGLCRYFFISEAGRRAIEGAV